MIQDSEKSPTIALDVAKATVWEVTGTDNDGHIWQDTWHLELKFKLDMLIGNYYESNYVFNGENITEILNFTASILTEMDPGVPVVVMTGYGTLDTALDAMRRGARDFVQKPFAVDEVVRVLGRAIEELPIFPNRTNVEFVQVVARDEVIQRTWERGSGETFACGTGACAVAVAGQLNGLLDNDVTIHLTGGDLRIEWAGGANDPVYMTGPAVEVFTGEITRDGA